MTIAAVLLLASTFLYAGFQWTIRVLVYPQFAAVPGNAFAGYERSHQRRASLAVGPLFVFAGGSTIFAFATRPGIASAMAASCVAAILLVTAFAAVPAHRRLTGSFDAAVHARLLLIDSIRLALSLAAGAAAVGYGLVA